MNTKIKELLNEILNHQIANRGTKHAFYKCYTYSGYKMPAWVKKAEKMLVTIAKAEEK